MFIGLEAEDYLKRRREKEAFFEDKYGSNNWWSWVAAGPGKRGMQAFPVPLTN